MYARFARNLNDHWFIDTRYLSLIVIDDLMRDATNSKDVCELFVEGSHHSNISVAWILQNGFSKGNENRTMSINTHTVKVFIFTAPYFRGFSQQDKFGGGFFRVFLIAQKQNKCTFRSTSLLADDVLY